jgi:membrane protease YdiL (CAAX protease family)
VGTERELDSMAAPVGFALALTLVLTFTIGFALSGIGLISSALASNLFFGALVEATVYGAATVLLIRRPWLPASQRRALGVRSSPALGIVAALALGVALHGPADWVEGRVERWLPFPDSVLAERAARLAPLGSLERIELFVAAVLLAPVVEELFFRGALYAALARALDARRAAIVTSACFVVSHFEPRLWPALSVVAAALGAVRLWSDSVVPGVLLHAAFNATTLAVSLAHPRPASAPAAASPLALVVGSAASLSLLALAFRGRTMRSESTP